MIVYVATRSDVTNEREQDRILAVWNPFATAEKAEEFINRHVQFRVKNGAVVQTEYRSIPNAFAEGWKIRTGGTESAPVMSEPPECIASCLYEVTIITECGKGRAQYRVTQMMVQE